MVSRAVSWGHIFRFSRLGWEWPCVYVDGRRRGPPAVLSRSGAWPDARKKAALSCAPGPPAAPRSPGSDLPASCPRRLQAHVRTRAGRWGSCSPLAPVVSPNSTIVPGRAASSRGPPVVFLFPLQARWFVDHTRVSSCACQQGMRRANEEVAQCAALDLPGLGVQSRQM